MHPDLTPLLTIAWALAFGVLAQVLSHAWRMPAIVLLLAFGIALGPEGIGLVEPESLGGGLSVIVKLAVAVILFEGAMNLRLRDLRTTAREVRGLVTVGVLVTWVLTTLGAHYLASLSWPLAILFGALMTVTGPTVIQPLMRRLSVPRRVKTVLEGEAILIDPIGAILAVAVFDVVLALLTDASFGIGEALWSYASRLVVGGLIGAVGGWLLARFTRGGHVPRDLVGLVALAVVWLVFSLAEAAQGEAGLMAAVAMGLAFQHGVPDHARPLRHFKEQLTTLGISLLFVLLAAELKLDALWAERGGGLALVLLMMFVIRPLAVLAATRGSSLPLRERLFIGWVGPRGIVAASVASLFAVTLASVAAGSGNVAGQVLAYAGVAEEGGRILSLTFLTIALTVTIQGLSAPLVARLLGIQSLERRRTIVVGAGPLGRAIAGLLRAYERPLVLVDRNAEFLATAQGEGFEVFNGNALDEKVLEAAGIDEAETFLAATANPEINALAAQLAMDEFGLERSYPALDDPERGASAPLLQRTGSRLAFGRTLPLRLWDTADTLTPVAWTVPDGATRLTPDELPDTLLPVLHIRAGSPEVVHAGQRWAAGDTVALLTTQSEAEALAALAAPRPTATPPAPTGPAIDAADIPAIA